MQPLSAADSITPAFERTRAQLFAPFRFGRSWKLAVSAYLALFGAFFCPVPVLLLAVPWRQLALPPPITGLLLGGTAVYTLVLLLFFYLGIRFEMTVFGLAGTGGQFVAPLWRASGPRTWPWFLLKAVPGTLLSVLSLPLLRSMARAGMALVHAIPAQSAPGTVDPDANAWMFGVMSQIMGVYALVLAGIVLIFLSSSLLHDFVLPFYLLEPAPVGTSLRRAAGFWAHQPGDAALYVLLKIVLAVVGVAAQYLVTLVLLIPAIVVLVVLGLLGLLGAAVHAALSGTAATVFLVVGAVLLYALLIVYQFYVQLFTFGTLSLFLEHYGLLFVGSRYPPLGVLLDASLPPQPAPRPTFQPIPPPPTPPPFYSAGAS